MMKAIGWVLRRLDLGRFFAVFLPQDHAAGLVFEGRVTPRPGASAVIVPAHNEEAVIEATLRSLRGVFPPEDIFVFADGCTDRTVEIARRYVPSANVLDHRTNIGKSRGIQTILAAFIYPRRYEYVTVMDADTVVEPNFMEESKKVLQQPDVACAVGQIKTASYPKTIYAVYRVYVYWVWQNIVKRLQSFVHASTIASGTSTTWKTNVLRQLDLDHRMSTEDFNLTFQVHRRRLGKIKYVPTAVVWSQDPFTMSSFQKQTYRWSRAWWESVRKYRIGLKWFRTTSNRIPVGLNAVDIFTALLIFTMYSYWLRLLSLPLLLIYPVDLGAEFFFPSTREAVLISMAWQYAILILPPVVVAIATKKYRVIAYLPVVLVLSAVDLITSLKALVSVARNLYRPGADEFASSVWVSPERRPMSLGSVPPHVLLGTPRRLEPAD
jgi:cellulose synthase/poly-beta-1,6-N-acetylglucosamine synthase-like glycosyltransferase